MKNISIAKLLMASVISLSIFSNCSSTRHSGNKNDTSTSSIKNMVDSQHFTFVAETVNPLSGRFRNLTSPYDVTVSKDSVVSFLPYFGRAQSAPLDPSEGGIKFTSTKFSYKVDESANNKWYVVIKPEDRQDVQQLNLTVFNNGTATLNVTSAFRDPISFNGHLK